MNQRIVVIGGSFNPPTIAHYELMKAAIEAANADIGIFVLTGEEYVLRKLKRQKCTEDIIGENTRLRMLESFCRKDKRMAVSRIQMENQQPGDYEVLKLLQAEYPEAEIYFVFGSDKLYVLPAGEARIS